MKRCSNYPQSIQFTFQHKTFLSFEDAKRALVNKNLLPAEPAVVFYYAGNPRKEHVMLGIGNEHDSSEPLIITESISPTEAEQITSVLGNDPIQIPVYTEDGEVSYITTVTGALNYLANAVDTDNFLGDFDSGDDLNEAFADFAYPAKESGVYTYKIHYDDGSNSMAQLEIYTDNDNNSVQIYTDSEGHKVTRTKKNGAWTEPVDVIPFTSEYLQSIVGEQVINDAVTSRNTTWSSYRIEREINAVKNDVTDLQEKVESGNFNLDADNINTTYVDPDTGISEEVSQQEFNERVVDDIKELVEEVIVEAKPTWGPI